MFTFSILEIFVCLFVGLALLEEVLLMFMFRPFRSTENNASLPRISILLAMRDEEQNVDRCLEAIRNLDYPREKMEILVGDDDSSDQTWEKLLVHAKNDDRIRLLKIEEQAGLARGKANVLAHLIRHATSDYFLITDADVQVNPRWARRMAGNLQPHIGLVNGLTAVEGNVFQHLEWIQAQGMMHVLQQFVPVTAIGNNMMVTRGAYEATGGFENISMSVTEDFALTREVIKHNYRLQSRLSRPALGTTLHQRGFRALLSQRKRWMQGAVRLPAGIVFLLIIRALYYPAIILMFFLFPFAAIFIFISKALMQLSLIYRVNRETDQKPPWYAWLLFEIYECIMVWLEIIIYLLPGKVNWKGRDF